MRQSTPSPSSPVGRFRKKPVVVEAMQFSVGQDTFAIFDWAASHNTIIQFDPTGPFLKIDTLEGVMTADAGDWIIKGVKGEFYPCKPDVFAETYEVAS